MSALARTFELEGPYSVPELVEQTSLVQAPKSDPIEKENESSQTAEDEVHDDSNQQVLMYIPNQGQHREAVVFGISTDAWSQSDIEGGQSDTRDGH